MLSSTMHNRYIDWEFIGQGGDAIVYQAYDTIEKQLVAIKKYNLEDGIIPTILLRETSVLRKSNCKGIISLKEIYKSDKEIFVVLEFAGSTILNLVFEEKLDKDTKNKILTELTEIVNYLHSIGYIHGDLSLKNILYNGETKLIDFCSAIRTHREHIVYKPTLYVCPYELVTNIKETKVLTALDVWSLGCVNYFLTTNQILFLAEDETEHIKTIEKSIRSTSNYKPLELIKKTNNEYIKKMLTLNPNKRQNLQQICNINKCEETIYTLDKFKLFAVKSFDKIKRIEMIKKIKCFDNYEIFFVTFKNLCRMEAINHNLDNFIIGYWSSCRIILGIDLNHFDLLKYSRFFQQNSVLKLNDIYNYCETLNWDVDPYTVFDYIKYYPVKIRKYFIKLNFLLLINPAFDTVPDICKIILTYGILKKQFSINDSYFESLICDAINKLDIDICYLIKLYTDILVYYNHCQNDYDMKIMGLNDLFGNDLIKWFDNINFSNLYENSLF